MVESASKPDRNLGSVLIAMLPSGRRLFSPAAGRSEHRAEVRPKPDRGYGHDPRPFLSLSMVLGRVPASSR